MHKITTQSRRVVAFVRNQMMTFRHRDALISFEREEDGASMAEYALLLGLIAVAAVAATTGVGTAIIGLFTAAGAAITAA